MTFMVVRGFWSSYTIFKEKAYYHYYLLYKQPYSTVNINQSEKKFIHHPTQIFSIFQVPSQILVMHSIFHIAAIE